MIFPDQVVTEITVPNNVPFLPGFNVIGIGTELPPEMVAAGLDAAIIFYTDTWSAAATTPKVKYFFLGTKSGSLLFGLAYSNNPSTTAVSLRLTQAQGMNASTGVGFLDVFYDSLATPIHQIWRVVESAQGASIFMQAANGNTNYQQDGATHGVNQYIIDPSLAAIQLQYSSDLQLLQFGGTNFLNYGLWTACTYANGWSAKAAPGFGQRSGVGVIRLPDGTVHLSGVANVGVGTPGTFCVLLPSSAYWPHYGTTFTAFQEASPDYCSLTLDATNGAFRVAGTITPTGAVHFQHSWVVDL